jgi:hypothetical protein
MHPLDPAWQALVAEFESAQARAVSTSRSKVSEDLNQTARRLKHYKTEADWYDAVLDGAVRFAPETALFALADRTFNLKGVRGFSLPADLTVSAETAGAFRNAIDSDELVVALATANEVSEPIASAVPSNRALLLPISNGLRTVALLFCVLRDDTDSNALELIQTVASSVLERHSREPAHLQISLAPAKAQEGDGERAEAKSSSGTFDLAGLNDVPEEERLQHVRARRAARSKVAEMQLYRPEACEAGRVQKNLYIFLKREIDSARGTFRDQFLGARSMRDYLHLELLTRLAQNDNALLGAEYPGPMV